MLERYLKNPIITRTDIPFVDEVLNDFSSVFNPGAMKIGDTYYLILRVQSRSRETFLFVAKSNDGFKYEVERQPIEFEGIENFKEKIFHIYDPRLTYIDNKVYIVFATDTPIGCCLGTAYTTDFESFKFVGATYNDSRNGIIFPEKINNKYVRLERPNKVKLENGTMTGNAIWLSTSNNLIDWELEAPVMEGRFHYWDELIGSGPPPVKTRKGWLHIYHGVAMHFGSSNIYQAGVSLLDLQNPSKVIGRSRNNILEPRELYELTGQVPNVVFPSGMIVEKFDNEGFALPESEVKIYYGAADTVVAVAITTVEKLLLACREPNFE